MVFIYAFIILLLIAHTLLIENYRKWFLSVKPFSLLPNTKPGIFFTVIIPARNEENKIAQCLETVLNQNYPTELFEVIVADDYSTDKTPEIILALQNKYHNLRLLRLQDILEDKLLNSYKKKAIEVSIDRAKGDWIITTDADCSVTKNWLLNFDAFIKKSNPVFIAAPVQFTNTGSFVSIFQCLDFISLQGITAASVYKGFHSMCNGANLAYKKEVFFKVGGFKGIDNIASGDDMLLMHKIFVQYQKPGSISFFERFNCANTTNGNMESFYKSAHPMGQQGR